MALDRYVWGGDLAARNAYWVARTAEGTLPDRDRDTTAFCPTLATKAPFLWASAFARPDSQFGCHR